MTPPCAECGHANRDGARFCAECGTVLAHTCPSCGATLSPSARFCDVCGAAAVGPADSGAAPEARKVLTVVFADLAGSTALQEQLDAESVRRVMTRFYELMRAVLQTHGGALEKFIGDAVVALFGRPVVQEDDALRAVRAAAAMSAGLESLNAELERVWGVRLRMRTGVNTGELVVSDTGAVVGDAMNTAARLEQAAPEGEVLIGEGTWRLVRDVVELHEVQPLRAKGKSAAVRAWRVVSVPPANRRRTAGVEAPLVGRVPELARLGAALDEVLAARACRLVSVVGSPGVGKSRLLREFGAAVADRATVVEGHCEPTAEGITLLPVAEILRAVAGIGEADPADVVRTKLAALVPDDDPDRERLVERSAGVLGVVEPASAQETFWALRRGIEFLAREQPLVLVFDDLHWGQPLLLDLVEHLVEWVSDAPVLLVALARPELRDVREALVSGRRAADVIELEPLDERESLELVDGLLGEVRVPAVLRARILDVTEGNPLFLGETLRMLVDDGALLREGDVWVPAEGLDAVEVPPTIQALLAARIERLRPDERSVLERASVIGRQFYRGAVAELVEPPVAAAIDGHLEALRRKDMVEPEGTYWIDEPVYRFHHVLIRDAAYRSLLKEARSDLHERFADWLQDKAVELVGEHEEVVAFHLEQAHEYRRELGPLDYRGRAVGMRAAERLGSAGRRALAREDLAAAANLLSRALARDAGDQPGLLWALCDAVLSAGDTATASGLVQRFAEAAGEEEANAARVQVLRGQLANLTGAPDVGDTARALTDAAATLANHGDREGEARAHQVAAGAYARLGQVGAVEEELDRALAAARAASDRRRTTAVLAAAPRAALWGPSPVVRASGRCLDVVRILRMTPGNRHVEAIALRCQAVLEAMRGRVGAARDILAAGRTTLEELGLAFELSETAVHAGIVELLADEPAAACAHLRAARTGFEALGAAAGAGQAAALLARALVAVGDDASVAEAVTESEFAEAHSGEDLKTVIVWTSARAQALGRSGHIDSALALARRATTLAQPTDALADKGDAALALADVLIAAGRGEEAKEVVKLAAGWYGEKGHTVGVERARRLADATPATAARSVLGDREQHEYDDDAMLAHRAELNGAPALDFWTRYRALHDAHDVDGLLELIDEDWVMVDHRQLGWEEWRGIDGAREQLAAAFELAPDLMVEIEEELAGDGRVLVARGVWRGSSAEGGPFETSFGMVVVVDGERWVSADVYEPDDRRTMIARYAELGGGLAALGDRPPENWWRQLAELDAACELDRLVELYAEACAFVDHRSLGWPSGTGRAGVATNVETVWKGSTDVRVEVDEVLACDEARIALRASFRGTGNPAEGAGAWAYPIGAVAVIEDGLCVRVEYFAFEDRAAMLARYTELGGQRAVLGDLPPERYYAEWIRRWSAGDLDSLHELYAPGWVLVEHRALAAMNDVLGSEERRPLLDSILDAVPDARFEIEDVVACDERVIALDATWRGSARDGGGPVEVGLGIVTVIEDGLERRMEVFEPGDSASMIACYAELEGGQGALGERPPERWWKRLARAVATRDRGSLGDLWDERYEFVDHRAIGWEDTVGRSATLERWDGIWDGSSHVRPEVQEVLACDERKIALRVDWRGAGRPESGGGEFVIPVCVVVMIDSDRAVRWEQFEPEDRSAALARFAELRGRAASLGDRPPERFFAEFIRRWAVGDLDSLEELYVEDWVFIDHRPVVNMEPFRGIAAAQAMFASIRALAADVRFEVDEVLACDDRVIVTRAAWRGHAEDGGGDLELPVGVVNVVRDGLWVSADVYEVDDHSAMIARYAELGGGQGPLGDSEPERWCAGYVRCIADHDLDALADRYAEDWVFNDHRTPAWETVRGIAGVVELQRSGYDATLDLRAEIDDVLARGERAIAFRMRYVGHSIEGGGAFEMSAGWVMEIVAGRARSSDMYEPDDVEGMLARFAEVTEAGAAGPLGDRPPERFSDAYARAFRTRDLDQIAAFYHEHYVLVDHRPLGWEPIRGREAAIEVLRRSIPGQPNVQLEFDDVLACDDRVIVLQLTWRGHGVKAGEVVYPVGNVNVLEDGRWCSCDVYPDEDHQAMIARYAELGGGLHPLGETAAERYLRAWIIAHAAQDAGAIARLTDPGYTCVDHRPVDHRPRDHAGHAGDPGYDLGIGTADLASGWEATDFIHVEVEEVLATGEESLAVRLRWRGVRLDGSGPFELPIGLVASVKDGRGVSWELYESGDRDAMLARYGD